ncbi:MAG: peptide deformylase [Brevinema sp.]
MAVQKIVTYGHPALRRPAQKILQIDEEVLTIIQDLKDTLQHIGGLGLAAPQIGIEKQIFIADLSLMQERRYAGCKAILINPEIVLSSKKTDIDNEGCLSLITVRGNVERSFKIKIRGLLPTGSYRTIETSGLYARVLQHEYDHLHGKLFFDYFTPEEYEKNKHLIYKYIEENKKNLPEILE